MRSIGQAGIELARPDLPKPGCRVMLVCGPPAAGKTTHIKERASADDIVIDFDAIARERGYGLNPPAEIVSELLCIRNARLAALAGEPSTRVVWVALTAPSDSLRGWWCETLGVRPEDLILLRPTRTELYRRIREDPERAHVRQLHYELVDHWFNRDRVNDAGKAKGGCDEHGFPTDSLHPWRKSS